MEQWAGPEETLESRCFRQQCGKMFLVSTQGTVTPPSVKYIVLKKNRCYVDLTFYFFALKRIETNPSVPFSGTC